MPPSVFPTGTTLYNPEKAFNCYVLIDGRDGRSYLIDMNGNDVHSWPFTGFPAEMIDPEINGGRLGDIICQKEPEIFSCENLLKVDWDGKILWEWGKKAPGGAAKQNHDLAPLSNGNILLVAKVLSTLSEITDGPVNDQAIYEVTPDGDIVWKWISSEHIEELGFAGERKNLLFSGKMRPRSSIFVINDMAPLGPNRWHEEGDARFDPDNIMIDSREASFIAIIEKKTGRIVWRMGPDYPANYDHSLKSFTGNFPRPVDTICGQHDAHMIPKGLPGGGNIMVFDNQGASGFPPIYLNLFPGSRVVEIDPTTQEIVWQYDASCGGRPFWTFFSSFISSARRLPNNNTLICEGMHGRLFQVTEKGEIVWEYVNPHFGRWTDHDTESGGSLSNYVFRAQPIPYSWVPPATPRSERPVKAPEVWTYRVPV
jgi:Arylsulfotransferase (ASST)